MVPTPFVLLASKEVIVDNRWAGFWRTRWGILCICRVGWLIGVVRWLVSP